MRGSNQKLLPCEVRSIMSWLFTGVQNHLQNRRFTAGCIRLCSRLFVWVGVLLVYMSLAARPTLLHLCMVASPLRYTPRVMQQWVSLHGAGIPRDRIWNAAGGQELYWELKGLRGSIGRRGACGRDKSRDQTEGLAMIGLPDSVRACLFDLDGVLTRTATVHAAAWKEMFDGYLRERAARTGEEFVPFDPVTDYTRYVDGKPRYDGVRSFLTARGIELPEGASGDPPAAETVRGLGNG